LSEEEERELCKQIHERYIDPGFDCPLKVAQILARRIHGASVPEKWAWGGDDTSEDGDEVDQDAIETGVTGKRRRKPRKGIVTRRWRAGFIERNGFSLRRPHLKRCPPLNDELAAAFLEEVDSCFQISGRDRILNMDETRWCLINPHQITIAPRGAEGVRANFNCDPKISRTAITIISAAADKLPLWIICRGTTERCEQRFAQRRLVLCHQVSRWTDTVVAKTVLRWISERTPSGLGCLLWDAYRAYRDQAVKGYAVKK
jgi:hypothetical protein